MRWRKKGENGGPSLSQTSPPANDPPTAQSRLAAGRLSAGGVEPGNSRGGRAAVQALMRSDFRSARNRDEREFQHETLLHVLNDRTLAKACIRCGKVGEAFADQARRIKPAQ